MAIQRPNGGKRGKRGPTANADLMEYAVQLRLRGCRWSEIEKAARIPHQTLMDWRLTPAWEALRTKIASTQADRVTHLSFEVIAQILGAELTRKRPDPTLAKWWIERATRAPGGDGDGESPGGYAAHPGIVILPMPDRGLESLPPTQVLMPPPAAAAPPGRPPESQTRRTEMAKGRSKRRRAAGPDE